MPVRTLPQVIDAEIARRQMLEESPIPSTNEEPVLFDTAEIPWWAWIRRFHLPEVSMHISAAGPAACLSYDHLWTFMSMACMSVWPVGLSTPTALAT